MIGLITLNIQQLERLLYSPVQDADYLIHFKKTTTAQDPALKMQSERASDHLGSKSHTKMKRKRMNGNVNESLNE